MKIKLGIAPIAWSNDDMPELGGDTPIEQCLEEASVAGFTGIELGGKFPRNPGITNFLLKKYNLKSTVEKPYSLDCFVTDLPMKFERLGKTFLGEPIGNPQLVYDI